MVECTPMLSIVPDVGIVILSAVSEKTLKVIMKDSSDLYDI